MRGDAEIQRRQRAAKKNADGNATSRSRFTETGSGEQGPGPGTAAMREDKRPAGAPCQPRSGPAHRKTLQAHETPHLNPKTEKQQLYYQRILETAFLNYG